VGGPEPRGGGALRGLPQGHAQANPPAPHPQDYHIRLLDPDKQEQSESLRDNSKQFVEKVSKLTNLVSGE